MPDLLRFDGAILGASFASGHTFVFGRWHDSPFGGFADLMRRDPDGTRTLVAPIAEVERFVDAHYRFDRVERAPVAVDRDGDRVVAVAGDLTLELDLEGAGLVSRLLRLRPAALRTWPTWIGVEDVVFRPIVAPLLGGGGGIHARGSATATSVRRSRRWVPRGSARASSRVVRRSCA